MQSETIIGAGGIRLSYDRLGSAGNQPLILLHGGGQTRGSWGTLANLLAERGYDVFSLDLRGHGDSEWASDKDYSLSSYRDDLRALLATIDRPPVLVGASLGGVTALLTLGEGTGDEAVALVLVDITPWIDETETSKIADFMRNRPEGFEDMDDAVRAVSAYLPHRTSPQRLGGLTRNLRRDPNGRLKWHWDPQIMAPDNAQEAAARTDRMVAAAHAIRVPTLLVRGEHSRIVRPEHVAELCSIIPGLKVVEVAGAGHMVAGDDNDAFDNAVTEFLKEVPAADPHR